MSMPTPSHTTGSLLVMVCLKAGFILTVYTSPGTLGQNSGPGPVAVIVYNTVSTSSPVLIRMSLSTAPVLLVSPLIVASAALVQLNTDPATSEVGVKLNCAPLQIVTAAGTLVRSGVGLTITLEVPTTGAQLLPLTVNVYTTVSGELVLFCKVSAMLPVANGALGLVL